MASNYHRWINKLRITGATQHSPGKDSPPPKIVYRTKPKPRLPNAKPRLRIPGAPVIKTYADSQGI